MHCDTTSQPLQPHSSPVFFYSVAPLSSRRPRFFFRSSKPFLAHFSTRSGTLRNSRLGSPHLWRTAVSTSLTFRASPIYLFRDFRLGPRWYQTLDTRNAVAAFLDSRSFIFGTDGGAGNTLATTTRRRGGSKCDDTSLLALCMHACIRQSFLRTLTREHDIYVFLEFHACS